MKTASTGGMSVIGIGGGTNLANPNGVGEHRFENTLRTRVSPRIIR